MSNSLTVFWSSCWLSLWALALLGFEKNNTFIVSLSSMINAHFVLLEPVSASFYLSNDNQQLICQSWLWLMPNDWWKNLYEEKPTIISSVVWIFDYFLLIKFSFANYFIMCCLKLNLNKTENLCGIIAIAINISNASRWNGFASQSNISSRSNWRDRLVLTDNEKQRNRHNFQQIMTILISIVSVWSMIWLGSTFDQTFRIIFFFYLVFYLFIMMIISSSIQIYCLPT